MKKLNCNHVCELLSSYLDRETTIEEGKMMEAHLADCPDCAGQYQELLELKNMMDQIKEEEMTVPEGFTASVMEAIEKETQPEQKAVKAPIWEVFLDTFFQKPWIPVMLAAMFMVVLYVPGVFGPMGARDNMTQSAADGIGALSNQMAEPAFTRSAAPQSAEERGMNITATSKEFAPEPGMAVEFADDSTAAGTLEPREGETARKIIRNGALSLEVAEYQKAEQGILRQAEELGGFISNSHSYVYGQNQDLRAGHLSIRVPEEHFDQMMAAIDEFGRITARNVFTNDVTEMYMDMETRIRNLEIKEERLLAILNQQGALQDLLAVEKEIADTRSEIERLTGRLQLLKNQVAFSTIDIDMREVRNLEQNISGEGFSDFGSRVRNALVKSINLMLDYTAKGVVVLVGLLPFLVLLLIIVYGGNRIWKNRKQKQEDR